MSSVLQMIPIGDVHESPRNPRKIFDQAEIEELAASIRAKGIVTPVLVRPVETGGFELAAGHRRRRAAELAGLVELPAIVREMTDDDFLEVLTIENLQRKDLHPLEEAEGYRALIDNWRAKRSGGPLSQVQKEDVERVAKRVGKSVSYVYGRLKLLELTDQARKAFERGKLTAGHAVLIARLDPASQQRALEECFGYGWARNEDVTAVSVRSLADSIRHRFHISLSSAPFKMNDAELLPEAGACRTCPKMAGNNPGLHDGLPKNMCTDVVCFKAKLAAFSERQLATLRREGKTVLATSVSYDSPREGVLGGKQYRQIYEPGEKPCPSAVAAVWVDGSEAGKTVKVCVDRKCPVHAGTRSNHTGEEGRRRREAKAETERRRRIYHAVHGKVVAAPPRDVLNVVAAGFWEHIYEEHRKLLREFLGCGAGSKLDASTLSDDDLWRLIVGAAVVTELTKHPWNDSKPNGLLGLARSYGVDVSAIDRDFKAARKVAKRGKAAEKKRTEQTSAPMKRSPGRALR